MYNIYEIIIGLMNILTYNTSWKSTEPTKLDDFGILGNDCKNNVEKCRFNIRSIIFDKSKQYDFIGLQELTNELFNIKDQDNSIEYTRDFDEYTLIVRGINIKNIIIRIGILYNNVKYQPLYTIHGCIYSNKFKKYETDRLYIATLFKINQSDDVILIINGHFPHDIINNITPFKYIQDEIKYKFNNVGLKINNNTPFIFMGDFNRDLNKIKSVSSFTFLDQPLLFSNNIKTCCTTDNTDRHLKLDYESDHIIFSKKFYKNPIYNVIDLYPASDHFALSAYVVFKSSSLSKNINKSTVFNNDTLKTTYGGKKYKIYIGSKGGKYILIKNKKRYI